MLVRVLVCAIAMLGMASPAVAGERLDRAATPDVMSLLLQDEGTTFGSPTPFALQSEPLPDTLTRFDALMVPATTLSRVSELVAADFTPLDQRVPSEAWTPFDARRAIADVMADYPHPLRRRDIIDTMVTLHLDGQHHTRPLTVGGVAGVVWEMMPRR